MYYGKMTKELKKLYLEYEKVLGHRPDGCEDVEYGEDEYDEYVGDIKKALELKTALPNLYSYDDDEF